MSLDAELALVPPTSGDALLTPDEVASRLKVSRSMIYSEIKRGRLHAIYIGRLPRITEAALKDYLAAAERGS